MSVEMEGLEFQIETTAEEGVKGVDALRKSLSKLKSVTKGGLGLSANVKELQSLNKALSGFHIEKLHKSLKAIGEMGNVKISSNIATQLGNIVDVMERITLSDVERLEDMTKALRELGELSNVKIPKVTVPSNGIIHDTGATPSAGASVTPATSGVENVTSTAQQAGQAVDQVTSKTSILKRVLSSVGGVFSKGFSVGTGALHKLGNALTQVKVAGEKAKDTLGRIRKSLGSALAAKVKQNTSGLGQMFNSLKRIAMYRAIRFFLSELTKAMREGINNLYQYSNLMGGTFAQSMDTLATSASYLKNSLGAMAAPIINALAPAIDFVIDKIVTLLNYINMLFARLSGATTFTAAKKNAQSYGDSLESAGSSASKAAKEIRDATTGIDELNIIMQKDDTSGGGGGGATDYGSMFEELPIDNSVSEFADKLKQAFDNADWKTLGTLIGGKVNEIIDSIDWAGIGNKIGYAINGAVQTAYWFLKTVDFHNLGESVATLVNNALEQIDTEFVGRLIVRWFTVGLDFVLGFLGGLDWGLLARKLSDLIKGVFDEATEWLNGYDWSQIGKDLWENIKEVVTNIDWGGIATSMFTFLGTAIRSAGQFLGSFFGSIGSDIKTWWDNEIAGEDWKQTGLNLLNWIGEGLTDIGGWCMTNIIDPFCNALLGEEKWASIKQAGADMWAGFTQGLTEFFADPGAWIKTHIVDPFVQWFKDLFGIHSPSTVMEEIGQYVVEGFLEGINFFSSIAGTVKKWGSSVVEWFTKGEDGKGIVEHFKEIAGNIISGFKDKVGSTYTTVKTNVTTWASKVKEWFTSNSFGGVNLSTFATYANETIEGFKSKIGSAYTNVKTNITTWASKVKEWFTSSSYGGVNYQNFSTFANNTIEGFKSKIGSAYTTVKTNVTTWASKVKEWFTSSSFGGVNSANFSTFASNVITGFKDKIGSAYTTTKSNIQTWATNVKNWFTGIASNSAFAGFASDVINGFKNKIGSYYTTAKSNITTWASKVKEWFQSENSNDSWSTIAKNIVDGFANGVTSWARRCKDAVVSWGQSVLNWFEDTLDINSPSKVFYKIGGFAVAGFNNAIAQVGKTTRSVVGEWANSFTNITPTMAMAVDTSALRYYDSDAFARTISSNVETNNEISSTGFKQAMEDFYREYVEPTLNQIAEDTRRQADKDEHPIVQIGNRVITDAVDVQTKANGYRFTK